MPAIHHRLAPRLLRLLLPLLSWTVLEGFGACRLAHMCVNGLGCGGIQVNVSTPPPPSPRAPRTHLMPTHQPFVLNTQPLPNPPSTRLPPPQAGSKAAASAAAALELDSPEGFYALLCTPLEAAASNEVDLDDDDETAPPELLRPPTALLALEDAACGQGNAASSSNGPGADCTAPVGP